MQYPMIRTRSAVKVLDRNQTSLLLCDDFLKHVHMDGSNLGKGENSVLES
jgi:hypothetical protein